ncbi:MAG: hypothetical protein GKS07_06670 [Nitrosopumilus sp.]|nr:MAG: hypothetical protein GKS07_06670 [Nitrosopumilus sp.]
MANEDNYETEDISENSDESIITNYDEMREEYKSEKKGFLGNLKKKADTIKDKSVDLGKTTAKGAEGLGNKIDSMIDDGVSAAKAARTSKDEILDLLERLAKMKEKGILTEKEFTQKKKDLLEKI